MQIVPFKMCLYIISHLLFTLPLSSEKDASSYSLCSLYTFWMIMSHLCRNFCKPQSLIQSLGIKSTRTNSHGGPIAITIIRQSCFWKQPTHEVTSISCSTIPMSKLLHYLHKTFMRMIFIRHQPFGNSQCHDRIICKHWAGIEVELRCFHRIKLISCPEAIACDSSNNTSRRKRQCCLHLYHLLLHLISFPHFMTKRIPWIQ